MEIMAKLLKLGVKVDKYGRCGTKDPCNKKVLCTSLLQQKYKFYMAFENAHCEDYITGKCSTLKKTSCLATSSMNMLLSWRKGTIPAPVVQWMFYGCSGVIYIGCSDLCFNV